MKKNFRLLSLIASVLVIAMLVVSCKKKTEEPEEPEPVKPGKWWSPKPSAGGILPLAVLPEDLVDTISQYFTIHSGENPPVFYGQFKSSPHILRAANWFDPSTPNDTIGAEYYDRYIAFFRNGEFIDFYGKQWDKTTHNYYEEVRRQLYVVGEGEEFTCYYLTEGYPNGMYAKQSTIFSGNWNESLGGLGNFEVAVILLETSGNPNLGPRGSYRILGDGDGLAQDTAWLDDKRAFADEVTVTDEDLFGMFRVK